jgi:PAS domain S-box-containing protein
MGYIDLTKDGFIAQSNIAAQEMLGISAARPLKHPFISLVHFEDHRKYRNLLNRVAKSRDEKGTCELRVAGKTGDFRFVQIEMAPSIDETKKITGWRMAFVDITERKLIEEELRKTRDELEIRVKQRTSELSEANKALRTEVKERGRAQADLQLYMQRLELSNRELQDFAFIASHDLQEPLRKIQAFGDMLRKKFAPALGQEASDYVDRMCRAAKRLQDMVSGLLDYSRIVSKGQAFGPVDLGRIVQGVLGDLEWQIKKNGAKVTVEDLPTVEADPNQMRQLFQNLISNAMKFRGEKPILIKIYGRPEPAAKGKGERWQIFVEDNGIGFDQGHAERIFALFQRLHGRSAYEGTGMGLAICRRIAEHHGGAITAHGSPGKGATFAVTLHLEHPPDAEEEKDSDQ